MDEINHDLWFEYERRHGHKGEEMECLLKYGHEMETDGRLERLDPDKLTKRVAIDPEGRGHPLSIYLESGKARTYYMASFIPETEGLYILAAEYEGGIFTRTKDGRIYPSPKKDCNNVERSLYSYKYCKAIVPVGHEERAHAKSLGQELEICPQDLRGFGPGDEIELEVFYDGDPLSNAALSVIKKGGKIQELVTDREGKATFELESGLWMFLVKQRDKNKGVKGQYDEKSISASLTLNVS